MLPAPSSKGNLFLIAGKMASYDLASSILQALPGGAHAIGGRAGHAGAGGRGGSGLHSFTSRLNVSTFCGIGSALGIV
jgi:hypothetical protein